MSDKLLALWLIVDVIWTILIFSVLSYAVFVRGYSGWWFASLFVLGPAFGGGKLYQSLRERTKGQTEKP